MSVKISRRQLIPKRVQMFGFLVIALTLNGVIGAEFREKRNILYKCVNCTFLLNRSGPECPKTFYECGECLEGFVSVRLTDEAKRHRPPCYLPEPVGFFTDCNFNSDCESGSFCFKQTTCIPCLNCQGYLRKSLVDCPAKLKDCGDCMSGFKEITMNDVKICEHIAGTHDGVSMDYMIGFYIVVFFVIIGSVFLLVNRFMNR